MISASRRVMLVFTLLLAMLLAASSAAFAQEASPEASPTADGDGYGGELVKEVLVSDENVESAPGETLSLTRYIIPAGAVLPVHYHPGVQMASVESGTFTYHVLVGEVFIVRADGTPETAGSGATVELYEGDSWIEPKGMIHYAENRTDSEVILISAALMETDEPATIVVDLDATPIATPAP